ncbi:cation:proton antiporter [Rhodococcus sp. NPDC003318]|uniref:cation:proton antiporter n=1 Tax=Rhodococcus sp. NPDC003318 TaxID=3364503 RepID=UPI00369F7D05
MELTLIAVIGVASIVTVAALSKRLGLATPLSLVVVGIGLSFVPAVPDVDIEPEWILAVVLPPLLYSAAVTMPAQDFRRNFKAISGLAVLLVVVTTAGAAALFHFLIPDIGWAAAFALGAVISPTDAVAATSVGRKLGLPSRLLTVLEGEGLVNDASALVLLRSAIAAMAGAVSMWEVAGDFVFAVVVASAIGVVVGILNVRVRAWFNDTVLNTAVSFVLPFVAFVPAEELGASGVLAVVVAGLVTGHSSPRYLRAEDRITEEMNWRTLAFLLESAVFLIMGLSLEHLLDEVQDAGLPSGQGFLIGLLASAFVIAVRMLFVVPLVAVLRRDERRAAQSLPRLERWKERLGRLDDVDGMSPNRKALIRRRVNRTSADIDFLLNETLGWRGGVVLAWSGMRGAITLAAAQTLPYDTPYRAELILIAFVVAVTTLLLQGLTLPMVIRWVKVPGDDQTRLRTEYGNLLRELAEAGDEALTAVGDSDPDIVERVRSDSLIGKQEKRDASSPDPRHDDRRDEYMRLRLITIGAERTTLLDARSRGTYSSQVLGAAQRRLDLEETRIEQLYGNRSE